MDHIINILENENMTQQELLSHAVSLVSWLPRHLLQDGLDEVSVLGASRLSSRGSVCRGVLRLTCSGLLSHKPRSPTALDRFNNHIPP